MLSSSRVRIVTGRCVTRSNRMVNFAPRCAKATAGSAVSPRFWSGSAVTLCGASNARSISTGDARSSSRCNVATRMPDIAWVPFWSVTLPRSGITTSVNLSCSTAGYFMPRSHTLRAASLARSQVTEMSESPRNRGSPPGAKDWPGSQCRPLTLMETALRPRRASAPPCAATACFTRSRPCWARAGPDPIAAPVTPIRSATHSDEGYFMAIPPIFPIPRDRRPDFSGKSSWPGILGSKLGRHQEEGGAGPGAGHHLGVIPRPPGTAPTRSERLRRAPGALPVILNPSLTPALYRCPNPGMSPAGASAITMIRIDFNRLRFLVIDDNAHMRRILRTLLHSFGTRDVYEEEAGASGLEAFMHFIPDIVITDWAMPIFDGLELTQMIRQPGANANPYVPIIMLSGHSEKKRVVSARDAGVTEFLAKPISAKALYQRILNIVVSPRSFIKTRTYFGPDRRRNTNLTYVGPERRKGGDADIIKQQALFDKVRMPG